MYINFPWYTNILILFTTPILKSIKINKFLTVYYVYASAAVWEIIFKSESVTNWLFQNQWKYVNDAINHLNCKSMENDWWTAWKAWQQFQFIQFLTNLKWMNIKSQ